MKKVSIFLFVMFLFTGTTLAHVLNIPQLLQNYGMNVSSFEEVVDQKVNALDFAVALIHRTITTTPTPTPSNTWPQLSFSLVKNGFDGPVGIYHAGDGSNRMFIVEQPGFIRIIKNGQTLTTPFLDISENVSGANEQGLLGLAFPPNFATKKYFYINYTDTAGDTRISRINVSTNADVANAASEQVLLTIDQPYVNHNGGQITFGPDGYLYIGMGDGGSSGDPQNRAQNPASLLGKMLRIDTENGPDTASGKLYKIPPTNPFVNNPSYATTREVWALGLRNPWRFSFDRQTQDLYIADVGQNELEEISYQAAGSAAGQNYGWRIMEGTACYNASSCNKTGLVQPVTEYSHSLGCSVTGGFVYRASEFPQMQNIYYYADYCSGRIWGLRRQGSSWQNTQFVDTNYGIASFGEDEAGNLYFTDVKSGSIYKIYSQ